MEPIYTTYPDPDRPGWERLPVASRDQGRTWHAWDAAAARVDPDAIPADIATQVVIEATTPAGTWLGYISFDPTA